MGNFKLLLNNSEDTLEIFKTPSRSPVQSIEGKYGITFCLDVNDNVVKIIIPEPDILFGIKKEYIQNFLMHSTL